MNTKDLEGYGYNFGDNLRLMQLNCSVMIERPTQKNISEVIKN